MTEKQEVDSILNGINLLFFSAIYFLLYSKVGSAAIMYSDSWEIE